VSARRSERGAPSSGDAASSRDGSAREDGGAIVWRGADARGLRESALVLRAVGIEHAETWIDGERVLVVRPADALRARDELQRYEQENRPDGTTHREPTEPLARPWAGVFAYVALLVTTYLWEGGDAFGWSWKELGRTEAGAIRGGQWWRTVTALTLHSDVPHLAGNVVFGALFGGFLAQLLGNGVGWLAVLAAGAAGNALNAWVQPEPHRSLGASTAVFGAVGLLVAQSLVRHGRIRQSRLRRWAPLVVGVALLGFLGTSGEHTDVVAHLTGFAAGVVLGLPLALRPGPRHGRATQIAAGGLALTAITAAWWLARARG